MSFAGDQKHEGTAQLSFAKHKYSVKRNESPTRLPSLQCIYHNEENAYFCKIHQTSCCESCVGVKHVFCPVENVANITVNVNRKLQKIKRIRIDIEEQEGDLRFALQNVKSHLKLAKKKIQNTFKEIRRKIDETENKFMAELETSGDEKLSNMYNGFDKYLELKQSIGNIIDQGEKLMNPGVESTKLIRATTMRGVEGRNIPVVARPEELLKFAGPQNEEEVSKIENCLKELKKLQEFEIGETIVIEDIKGVKQLCDSLVNVIKINTDQQTCQNQQAKTEIKPPSLDLEFPVANSHPMQSLSSNQQPVKRFSPDRQVDPEALVRCIKFIPNGDGSFLAATEEPNQLKRFNSRGLQDKYVDLPDTPHDMCFYENDLLAVTFPFEKLINIYNLRDLTKRSEVVLSSRAWRIYGICRLQDTNSFIVGCTYVVRNLTEENVILSTSGTIFKSPNYITMSGCGQYIFVSDAKNDEVVILNKDLEAEKVFKSPDFQELGDLCVSNTGSIFVCSMNGNCIVEVSKDGEYMSTILSKLQKLMDSPITVSYHAGNKTLIVANWKNDILSSVIRTFKGQ